MVERDPQGFQFQVAESISFEGGEVAVRNVEPLDSIEVAECSWTDFFDLVFPKGEIFYGSDVGDRVFVEDGDSSGDCKKVEGAIG